MPPSPPLRFFHILAALCSVPVQFKSLKESITLVDSIDQLQLNPSVNGAGLDAMEFDGLIKLYLLKICLLSFRTWKEYVVESLKFVPYETELQLLWMKYCWVITMDNVFLFCKFMSKITLVGAWIHTRFKTETQASYILFHLSTQMAFESSEVVILHRK